MSHSHKMEPEDRKLIQEMAGLLVKSFILYMLWQTIERMGRFITGVVTCSAIIFIALLISLVSPLALTSIIVDYNKALQDRRAVIRYMETQ